MADKKKSNLKKLLIILAGIIVLVIIISLVRGSSSRPATTTGLVTTTTTGQNVVAGTVATGQEVQTEALVALLREVSTLHLDNDVFLNPVFSALIDISSPLQTDQNPGRENPFLPIGDDGLMGGGTATDDTVVPDTFFTATP